jgi:hypothetical protein
VVACRSSVRRNRGTAILRHRRTGLCGICWFFGRTGNVSWVFSLGDEFTFFCCGLCRFDVGGPLAEYELGWGLLLGVWREVFVMGFLWVGEIEWERHEFFFLFELADDENFGFWRVLGEEIE